MSKSKKLSKRKKIISNEVSDKYRNFLPKRIADTVCDTCAESIGDTLSDNEKVSAIQCRRYFGIRYKQLWCQ